MGVNVGQVLRQGALRRPVAAAIVDVGAPGAKPCARSYAELDLAARRVAHLLRDRGVRPGARVALMAANSLDFVAAWFGVVYAGAGVVPLPVLSAVPEIHYRLQHAGCSILLCDSARLAAAREAGEGLGDRVEALDIAGLAEQASAELACPADTEPGDVAMVLYTSGTTGKPKGAAISHASLLTHTTVLAHHALRLTAQDTVLGVLPLTHSYGCRMVMLASFFATARCVLMPRFDATRSLELMIRERVSWIPAVPTMYAAWGALPEGPRPEALRWCLSAGAPLPDETARRAEARLGADIRQGYGMTEATFTTINAPPDGRVLGSVGKPAWGVEVDIRSDQDGPCAVGESGEVWVRGHNVMSRYLHDPQATDEARRDGWIRTGDVGAFDGEGRLTIVDRVKDMIIRGGNNVYPSEVEDALASHPDVAEVAVVGRPHAYYGEEVVAVVKRRLGTHPDAASIHAWARERVARTKVPREVAFVEEFPLGPSGKILKRELREWIAQGRLRPQAHDGKAKEST